MKKKWTKEQTQESFKKQKKALIKGFFITVIVFVLIIIFSRWMGHQELKSLIENGYLDKNYTQRELADLCSNPNDDVEPFGACISGGVW